MVTSFSLALLCQASILAAGADTYANAYRTSTETGRPMVVMVSAEWCPACQTMKETVIPKVKQRGLLGKVAFAIVNLDRQRKLGRELTRGGPIPQLLMFRRTAEGWKLSRLTGGQSLPKVEAFIDRGLKRNATDRQTETVGKELPREEPADTQDGQGGGKTQLASHPQRDGLPIPPKNPE
ncbi:MAG: hypothetical protein A2V98_07815 [Planctomycetes bacterium RBG_16_64_12]|nr:MAG: hypothetical protein A2V98_07815 [Planctomycetes bacterium RBG_16_64_12]